MERNEKNAMARIIIDLKEKIRNLLNVSISTASSD
jgi:hypothetical protein